MPGRILVDTTPLRESRDFRLLFIGQLVSVIGTQLTVVAIPYQVYSMTHSSFQVGAISLAQLFPFLAGALWRRPGRRQPRQAPHHGVDVGGLVAHQRRPGRQRRRGSPVARCLYVVSAVASGFTGFASTARMAAVPGMVERRHMPAASAMTQIVFQVGVIVGPALSGLLLGIGLPLVYGLDAASFVVAAVTSAMLAPIPPPPTRPVCRRGSRPRRGCATCAPARRCRVSTSSTSTPWSSACPGRSSPPWPPRCSAAAPSPSGSCTRRPEWARSIGAATTGWVDNLRRQGWAVIVAVCVWGAAIALFGFADTLWVALALLAVAGWADVISAVLRNTILQSSIPERFRSRMSSIQMAVVQGGPRLGDMESGTVAALTSIEFSVVSGGLACIAGAAVIGALLPVFRHQLAGHIDDVPV